MSLFLRPLYHGQASPTKLPPAAEAIDSGHISCQGKLKGMSLEEQLRLD